MMTEEDADYCYLSIAEEIAGMIILRFLSNQDENKSTMISNCYRSVLCYCESNESLLHYRISAFQMLIFMVIICSFLFVSLVKAK